MGISVSNLALSYYNKYAFTNSDTYRNNAVDPSEVSQSCYQVSNITGAFSALEMTNSVDLSVIGNLESDAKSLYQMSQLDFSNFHSLCNTDMTGILNNDTDLSGLYTLLARKNLFSNAYLNRLFSDNTSESSAVKSYESYLNSASGSSADSSLDTRA